MKRNFIPTLMTFIVMLFSYFVSGQEGFEKFDRLSFDYINIEQGLSQNYVYDIIQDRQGYLWIATWDGLNKFNGYNFSVYKSGDGEHELSNSRIHAVCEDNSGIIWVGTDKGLNKLYRTENKFEKIFTEEDSGVGIEAVWSLHCDRSYLWIGTQSRLLRYDREADFLETIPLEFDQIKDLDLMVSDIRGSKNGDVWIGTNYGLFHYSSATSKTNRYFFPPEIETGVRSEIIRSINEYEPGHLLVGTSNGIFTLNESTGSIRKIELDKEIVDLDVRAILPDSDGLLWIATYGEGIFVYNPKSGKSIRLVNNKFDRNSLCSDQVYTLFEDNSGLIWAGTRKGISKIKLNKFNRYFPSRMLQQLPNDIVRALYVDDNEMLWVGTEHGIIIQDRAKSVVMDVTEYLPGIELPSKYIRIITQSANGDYWIGTANGGVLRYNGKSGKKHHYFFSQDGTGLSNNFVYSILEGSDGYIWVGTTKGLNRIDPVTNEIRVYRHEDHENSLSHDIVLCLFENNDKDLWVGTYDGLNILNRETGVIKTFRHDPNDDFSIGSNNIRCVTKDKEGTIWIGTKGGGLNRFNADKENFSSWSLEQGLPNDVVYMILDDDMGNLWLSTNYGLASFNKMSFDVISYDVTDGVQGYEYNSSAAFKSKNGELFFGGMNGFNSFFPEQININQHIPPVCLTDFTVFNVTRFPYLEFQNGDTISLSYSDNFFSFEFAALDFINPLKNKYRYKLEGFDNDWIDRDAGIRFAEYKKIKPGTYIFRVQASNNDGVWNEDGMRIVLIIRPPWYGTILFRIILGLLIIGLIWLIFYLRVKSITKKHNIDLQAKTLDWEKQMFDLEQKALRLQMNPHFIFNSLNSIQSFVISNDTDKAINYLAKFAKLMRMILSHSREQYIALGDELRSLEYYLDIERLRFEDKFSYQITVSPEVDQDFVGIPPMLIQPYAENSILHGMMHKEGNGHIDIRISRAGVDRLSITIEDNGVGREIAKKKKEESGLEQKSRGMLIAKTRLEILNKQKKDATSVMIHDLKNEDGSPRGTKVVLLSIFEEL